VLLRVTAKDWLCFAEFLPSETLKGPRVDRAEPRAVAKECQETVKRL